MLDETVNRPKVTGFVILPRPALERSIAWTRNARRHDRGYERLIQYSETLITWASIALMTAVRRTILPTVACASRADTDLRLPHRGE